MIKISEKINPPVLQVAEHEFQSVHPSVSRDLSPVVVSE